MVLCFSAVAAMSATVVQRCQNLILGKNCIFCGEGCTLEPDKENPSHWHKASLCATADASTDKKDHKQLLLDICQERNDKWSREVLVRIQGDEI